MKKKESKNSISNYALVRIRILLIMIFDVKGLVSARAWAPKHAYSTCRVSPGNFCLNWRGDELWRLARWDQTVRPNIKAKCEWLGMPQASGPQMALLLLWLQQILSLQHHYSNRMHTEAVLVCIYLHYVLHSLWSTSYLQLQIRHTLK